MLNKLKSSFIAQWLVLIALLAIFGLFVLLNVYQRKEGLIQAEQQQLLTQARVINTNLSAQLKKTDYLLRILGEELSNIPVERWPQSFSNQRVEILVNSIPGINTILVLDDKGIVRLCSRKEFIGKDLGKRNYFLDAKTNEDSSVLSVSPPFKTLSGSWGINLVKTIRDSEERFRGIVVSTLDEEYFKTLLGSVNYSPDMWAAIAHWDGTLFLMAPEQSQLQGLNLAVANTFFSHHINSNKVETFLSGKVYATDKNRFMAQHTIKPPGLAIDKPLVVAVSRDIDTVLLKWSSYSRQQLITFCIIIVVTVTALAAFQWYQRKQITIIELTEQNLRNTQKQLTQIIDFLPDATFVIDTQKRVIIWNKAIEKMSGVLKEEMIGKGDQEYAIPFYGHRREHLLDLIDNGNIALEKLYSQVRRTGNVLDAETFCPALYNGKGAFVWVISVPLYDANGRHIGAIEAIRDISDRKQAEELMNKLSHGIENSANGFLITDIDGSIEYVNRKLIQMTGFSKEEVIGHNPRIFKSGSTPAEVYFDLWETLLSGKEWRGELLNRRKDGTVYWSITSISPLKNNEEKITHFIANIEDVNDRKNAEATIERLAYFDPLTGLSNRRMLRDRLDLALKRSRRHGSPLALLYLDLDSFKNINDDMGHSIGDQLLKDIASRLSKFLRDEDTVCRLGGDEFALILQEIRQNQDVVRLAEKLLEVVAQPLCLDGREIIVTTSIGITMFPKDADDGNTLEKNADIALYHAKSEGKNTFSFFSEELNESLRDRIALEHGLRHVLERQELELLYQPKVHLQTGRVAGVEALLRWNSPEFGTVSPLRFIPIAEETRQIIPIGEWALRTACKQQVAWQKEGLDLCMAVNLSAVQFKSPVLIESITAIIDETGISPGCLELELTESTLVDKPLDVVETLEKICSLGCSISIDDFGTGYSSLSYLKTFPVKVLKIDRSFVMDLAHDSGDRAIAQSVVNLASNLDMQTVAEGVENQEQLEILRQLGCTYIQGFVYSRPIPAGAIPAFVRSLQEKTID